jgi:hypothetical protein
MKQVQCLFLGFALLTGCASLPDQSEIENSAKVLASHNQSEALKQLQSAQQAVQKAENDHLAFYAPKHLQKAQEHLNLALSAQQKQDDAQDISRPALAAEKWAKAGIATRQLAIDTLGAAFKEREQLLAVHADTQFGEQFALLMQELNLLIDAVEQQKMLLAKQGQQKLLIKMQALEVQTVQNSNLGQAQQMFSQALTLGAETLLPQVTLLARASLQESQKSIAEHTRDPKRVAAAQDKALQACSRLFHLSQLAQRMSTAKEGDFEVILLEQEQHFSRLNKVLDNEDISANNFATQTELLEGKIQELKSTTRGAVAKASEAITVDELDKWQRKVALLQGEIMRLQRELDSVH